MSMKSRYRYIGVLIAILLIFVVAFIYSNKAKTTTTFKEDVNMNKKVAIIFSTPGLGDKSFNDLCYDGALKSQLELGVEFDYSEPKSEEEYDSICSEYAKSKEYELIISIGLDQENSVKKVSKKYPKQKFTIIDSKLNLDNVSSIYTNWTEQTFLNGVIAGLLMTEESLENNNLIGVIVGKDMEHLREGAIGFEAGARYINPNIETIVGVVDDFSNPAKAKEMALSMYNKDVNYIQHIAGESGLGVFAAAKEMNKYAFGVDDNQNLFEPNNIVATATRYANELIYKEIKSISDNTWTSGVHKFGIKEGIIGYTTDGSNVSIPNEVMDEVEKIKMDIEEGKIKIPSDKGELEKWVIKNNYKL